jgi:NTP pyrophosphatase (non-canonical NTP hydrolase)
MPTDVNSLINSLRQFSKDRDWEQFHSPKNLACALSVEVSEVLEHFQWLPEDQSRSISRELRAEVSEELADVFLYLLQLSDALGVNLVESAHRKIAVNASKYPVDKSKGKSTKYTKL